MDFGLVQGSRKIGCKNKREIEHKGKGGVGAER